MKKLYIRFTPEGEWIEVVGMTYSLTQGRDLPTVVERKSNKPIDMEKCIKEFERTGTEWRAEG